LNDVPPVMRLFFCRRGGSVCPPPPTREHLGHHVVPQLGRLFRQSVRELCFVKAVIFRVVKIAGFLDRGLLPLFPEGFEFLVESVFDGLADIRIASRFACVRLTR